MIATDITVKLGRSTILDRVDAMAQAGQITAIVGPNGSGKSTLLRALTGEIPFTGHIDLNGRALDAFAPWELAACRGVLQQAVTVAFPFTVAEVVQMGHRAGLAASDPAVPAQALAQVDLTGFAQKYYHELSGGEQQRTQLARVLAQVWQIPETGTVNWLFLDEPVSSLDIGHQFIVMDLMARFAKRGGGVVTVMHDLNLTSMFADHVILMKSGRVLAAGSVQDTLAEPVLTAAYDCPIRVNCPAPAGMPFVLPQARLA